MIATPMASVVLPTRDNVVRLEMCIDSILRDTSRVGRELIVVDNGSTDGTAQVVAQIAAKSPFAVRLITETTVGSSPARNTGVAHARGAVLLFTDDDVIVSDGWADALVSAFEDPAVGAVGGRTLPIWPMPPPQWLDGPHMSTLSLLDFGTSSRNLLDDEVPVGANMAVRTSVMRSFPIPFEVDLGYRDGRRYGYEETLLLRRIRRQYLIGYAADAVAHHQIDPNRMNLHWMRRTFFDRGVGRARCERHEKRPEPTVPRQLVRAFRLLRQTMRQRRLNDSRSRTGPETWAELMDYLSIGLHTERLFRRFPRITDLIGAVIVRN